MEMKTMLQSKPYTIDELVTTIYEDNLSHFEYMENMNGGDCDCNLHQTMETIYTYMEWPVERHWAE